MIYRSIALLFFTCFLGTISSGNCQDNLKYTRIACVGDSITHGGYPKLLKELFNNKVEVGNFGVSGSTLLNSGNKPYQKQPAFQSALEFKPDCVTIMLGTNDSKPGNWQHKDSFISDYKDLIQKFRDLPTHPKIYICYPPFVPGAGNYGINEAGVEEAMKYIDEIAKSENLEIIDMHSPLIQHEDLFADRVHPTQAG